MSLYLVNDFNKHMIMKDIILNKIAIVLNRLKIYDTSSEEAYEELTRCSAGCFNNLCAIYHLTEEEMKFIRSDQTA